MIVILDANILLRYVDQSSAQHPDAAAAVADLEAMGRALHTVPQSLYEFWVVATRPLANNGLGLTPAACELELAQFEVKYPPLPDLPTLYAEWRSLVVAHDCKGKVAHDARVAALRCRGLSDLLTFNAPDFRRFPRIVPLAP